jgi:hypothetical protein
MTMADERPRSTPAPATKAERDEAEDRRRVVCAVELGWRIAYLYADLKHPLHDAQAAQVAAPCLPAVESLSNSDQLELHVRAAASLAGRLKLDTHARQIVDLAGAARAAATQRGQREEVRRLVRTCHHRLIKDLWATREGEGKAYELGASLFDTWNRLRLASVYSPRHIREEWGAVFHKDRIERIKLLLDDLQTRLDPAAVTVVKDHLDRWHERVCHALENDSAPLPCDEDDIAEIRSQALIWRQLVTRDKEPEAYLSREHRTWVRHEFNRLMRASLWRPLPVACALAFLALVAAMVANGPKASATTHALVPILGAIGLTQASLIVVARERLRVWTELLWNRALAAVVFEVTCRADALFPVGRRYVPGLAAPAKAVVARVRTGSARAVARVEPTTEP